MDFLQAGGHRLEVQNYRPGGLSDADAASGPTLVFLHEGLGSVALWKQFPRQVAEAAGCPALVYSRYGYGKSDKLDAPRTVDYMHREALEVLPDVLCQLGIASPVLIGHSDGARDLCDRNRDPVTRYAIRIREKGSAGAPSSRSGVRQLRGRDASGPGHL